MAVAQIVALNRSSRISIGEQVIPSYAQLLSSATASYNPNGVGVMPALVDLTQTDVSGHPNWKAVAEHSSIGQIIILNIYGTAYKTSSVVTAGTGLTVSVSAGNVISRANGTPVPVAANTALALTAASTTLPRVDAIEVNYTSGALTAVAGTPTSGATLTNLTGAPTAASASTAGAVIIAYVLVPANATTVSNSNINTLVNE